ncbi:myo-inositol-1(or 4)-monophosphatase [Haloactinopolyspora alba]|uniref:Inositol-1-monophosphatase n=1 Tax=Haloactinopolyspora alba TaxID=648780 RepID=A0A2P8E2T5_9ACTN|nr:inositol monophosphatase family protein [Haloactinopolyspora alba]PSL03717.1 myo-inositol-1(or 4)-monophosphatase [Haloactinopolyspora alba]
MTVDPAALLALAESTAREAGAMVHRRREAVERMDVAATKSTPTDVVTESDTAAETLIRERLLAARPDDGILGEEDGHTAGSSGVDWVVDPIDGTVNYLYGMPQYAVSIAARADGVVVVGVVHNPASGETWTAVRGGGAHLDGRAIRVTSCDRLDLAMVGTGFGYDADRRARQAAVLLDLVPVVRDIRRAGAASLDLCWVATGRLDAYYERGLKAWDMAAGALVAEEAGAVVTGLRGTEAGEDLMLACTPGVVDELRALLERLGADRDLS